MMAGELIHQKMIGVLRGVQPVGKDGENKQQGYRFRSIEAVCNALHPILAEQGVYVTPEVLESSQTEGKTQKGGTMIRVWMRVKFTFRAEDGSSIEVVTAGEAADSSDKASNKAMTMAFKYALIQAFAIPTQEMADADRDSPGVADAEPSPAQRMVSPEPPATPDNGQRQMSPELLNRLKRAFARNWGARHGDVPHSHWTESQRQDCRRALAEHCGEVPEDLPDSELLRWAQHFENLNEDTERASS